MSFKVCSADNTPTPEYKLKAAIIYKVSKFVEWPWFDSESKPPSFSICILGEDYFGSAIESLQQRKIACLSIQVKRFDQSGAINGNCHLLFISDSKKVFLKTIFENLGDQPVLTIGDTENFAKKGGMIQFTREQNRIGFKINLNSAQRSNINIAAPLLSLATIINASDGEGD